MMKNLLKTKSILIKGSLLLLMMGFSSLSAQSNDCVHIFNSSVTGEKICDSNLVAEQKMKIQNLDAVGFVSNGKFSGSIWIPKDFKFGSAGKIANPVEIKVDQLPITATNQLAANTEVVNKYSDSATAIKALETVNFLVSYEGQASQTFSLKSLTASALAVELTVTPSEVNLTPAVPDANNYKLVRSVVLSGAGTKVGNDSNNFNASVNTSSVAFDYNLEFNFDTGVYKVTIKGGSSVVAEVGKYYYFNGMYLTNGKVDDLMTLRTGPGANLTASGTTNNNSWIAKKGDLVRIKSIHKDKITDASGITGKLGTYKLPNQSFWVEIEKVHTDGKIVSGYIIMYYLSDFSTSLAFKVKTRASGGATAVDFNFNGNGKGEKLEVCLESASKTLLCKTAESTSNVFDVSEGNSKFNIDLKNFLAPAGTDVAIFKDTEVKLSLRVYTDVSPNGSSVNKKYTFSLKKNNKQWFSNEFGSEAIWDETERTFYINGRPLEPSENTTSTIGGYYSIFGMETSDKKYSLRLSNAKGDADGSSQKPYSFAGDKNDGSGYRDSSAEVQDGHLVKLLNVFTGNEFNVNNNAWPKAKTSKWVQIELFIGETKKTGFIPMAWLKEFNNKLVLNFKSAQGSSEQAFKLDGNEYGDVYGVCLATSAQGSNCPAFGPGQNVTTADKSSFEINFDSILTTPLQVMTTKVMYISVKVGVKKNNVVGNKLFTFSVESGNGGWKLKGGADTLVWWHDDEIFDAKGSSSTGTSVGSTVKLGVHRITGQQTMRTQAGYTEANALYAATTLNGGGEWNLTPGDLVDVKAKVWDGFTNTYWVEVVSRKKDGSSEVNKNGFIQYKNIERSEMSFEFKLKKKKTASATEKLSYDGTGQTVLANVGLCIKDVSTDNTCTSSEIGSTLADLGDKASFNMNVETKYGSNPDYLTFKTFWLVANAKLKTNEVKKFSFAVLKDKDTSSWAISEGNDALVWDDETKAFVAMKTSMFSNSLVNELISNVTFTQQETSDVTASKLAFVSKIGDMTISGTFDNAGCVMGGVYGATTGEARFSSTVKSLDEKAWGTLLKYLQDLGYKNVSLSGLARAGGHATHCGGNAVDVGILDGEFQKNYHDDRNASGAYIEASKAEKPKHKQLYDFLFSKMGTTVNGLLGPWRFTGSACTPSSSIDASVTSNLKAGQCANYLHNKLSGGTRNEINHSNHLHITMTPSSGSSSGPLCANTNLDTINKNIKITEGEKAGTINYGPGGIGFSRSEFNQLICMNVSLSKRRNEGSKDESSKGCMIDESSATYHFMPRTALQKLSQRFQDVGGIKCEIGGQIIDCPKWTGPQPWGKSNYTTDFTDEICIPETKDANGKVIPAVKCDIKLPPCDPNLLPSVPSFPSFGGAEDSGGSTENPPNNNGGNSTTPAVTTVEETFSLEVKLSVGGQTADYNYNDATEPYELCLKASASELSCSSSQVAASGAISTDGKASKFLINTKEYQKLFTNWKHPQSMFLAMNVDRNWSTTWDRKNFEIVRNASGVWQLKDSLNTIYYDRDSRTFGVPVIAPTTTGAGTFYLAKKSSNLRKEANLADAPLYTFPADEPIKFLESTEVEFTSSSGVKSKWSKFVTRDCKIGFVPLGILGSAIAEPADAATAYDNNASKCSANMPSIDLANVKKIDQVAGFPFTTTQFVANTSGGFDVTGKIKIQPANVSLSGVAEREMAFKIDNKGCFIGSEYNFNGSTAGNWDVQGTWFGSQLGLSFKKLIVSSCLNGYLDGNLNLNSQAVMPYLNGERKFSANIRMNKNSQLADPSDITKGPLLLATTPASSIWGYKFTPTSIRISSSLADNLTLSGKLSLPINYNGSSSYEKDVVIEAQNNSIAATDISLGASLATKMQNLDLKVSGVRFAQISGVSRMLLKGKLLLPAPFTGMEADLTGIGITAEGKLLDTADIISALGVTTNAFGGSLKISNADLVQNEDGQNWDIRGAGKLKVQPKILGITVPTNELAIPELQLNYSAAENRTRLKVGDGVEIPNLLNTMNLSGVFSFKAIGVQIVSADLNGTKTDVIKIATELKSTYDWLKLKKKRTATAEPTVGILVFADGTTKMDELSVQFKLAEKPDNEDDDENSTDLIQAALTYKNGRIEGSIESKWLPASASIGLDLGAKFGFYVGMSAKMDNLPAPLKTVVGKVLGKILPVESVGLKIGYWQPDGASQRRAFVEVTAGFKLPPLPVVTLNGKILIGYSWEASKRIDLEGELSGIVKADMLKSLIPLSSGDMNLGKISLTAFWDITKGDFGMEMVSSIGPDLKISELKLDAKSTTRLVVGKTNGVWSFYFDSGMSIKGEMEYLSTLVDAGFNFEFGAGIGIGYNSPVKLSIPQTLKTRVSGLTGSSSIAIPTSFSANGGFIGYGSGSLSFYIDLPGFDKKTWAYDAGLYTHAIGGGLNLYAGVNLTTTFFLGDPMEIRLYYVRKPGGYSKVALDIWDVNEHEMWDSFVFETGVVSVKLDGTKAQSGTAQAVTDPALTKPPETQESADTATTGDADYPTKMWTTTAITFRSSASAADDKNIIGDKGGVAAHTEVMAGATEGDNVTFAGATGKWRKVKYSGYKGYLFSPYLTTEQPFPLAKPGQDISNATGPVILQTVALITKPQSGVPVYPGGQNISSSIYSYLRKKGKTAFETEFKGLKTIKADGTTGSDINDIFLPAYTGCETDSTCSNDAKMEEVARGVQALLCFTYTSFLFDQLNGEKRDLGEWYFSKLKEKKIGMCSNGYPCLGMGGLSTNLGHPESVIKRGEAPAGLATTSIAKGGIKPKKTLSKPKVVSGVVQKDAAGNVIMESFTTYSQNHWFLIYKNNGSWYLYDHAYQCRRPVIANDGSISSEKKIDRWIPHADYNLEDYNKDTEDDPNCEKAVWKIEK